MDEHEFQRLLDLFPVVRSRNYCAGSKSSGASTSRLPQDEITQQKNKQNDVKEKDGSEDTAIDDAFWEKLRLAAERKAGRTKADEFCKAFQEAHEKLVYNELSSDSARRFLEL